MKIRHELANDNKKPVLEYMFLLESNRALQEYNYRKCILDSATALEIGLTNKLDSSLCEGEQFRRGLLKDYNSLAKKRKLLNSLNINLPVNPQVDVEEVRNRTIHRGYNPSESEGRKAYETAKTILGIIVEEKFE